MIARNTYLVLIILIITSLQAKGPINKGTIISSGQLYFDITKLNKYDNSVINIEIIPSVGLFIKQNLSTGVNLLFKRADTYDDEFYISKYSLGLGTDLRYYLNIKRHNPFLLISLNSMGIYRYLLHKDKNMRHIYESDGGIRFEFDYFSTEIGVGYDIFITKSISIEPIVSISHYRDYAFGYYGYNIKIKAGLGKFIFK